MSQNVGPIKLLAYLFGTKIQQIHAWNEMYGDVVSEIN